MRLALFSACVFVVSAVGTGAVRRYALERSLLDVPNSRSSHSVPTPRGGGVAIVAALLAGVLVVGLTGQMDPRLLTALVGGGLVVAAVGFLDDHRSVPPVWRLGAHFLAATWAVVWLGGLPPAVLGLRADLAILGSMLAVVATVWLLNLYNFMDGIDGIASVEAITVSACAAMLYMLDDATASEIAPPLLLAVAVLGFLIWNFPRAKVFMGDAGSGFIGFVLAVLAIRSASIAPRYLWCWVILLGSFVVDATVTLVVRALQGKRVYEAHRSHAYQHAAARAGWHAPVTLAWGAVNVGWLLPWAFLVASQRMHPLVALAAAYTPLVAAAVWFGAGRDEGRRSAH